jgi:competence protein ComEC
MYSLQLRLAVGLVLLGLTLAQAAPARTLDIYFIDVEGGQSTLLVTPERQSLLIDAGWAANGAVGAMPGEPARARDAQRILAAARDAGLTQIDYLLMTHFHPDHDGGVVELSQLIPILHFIDHGTLAAEAQKEAYYRDMYLAYLTVRNKVAHLEPHPGDRLPIKGIDAIVVSSAASTIAKPLTGAGEYNVACGQSALPAGDPYENPRSTGIVVRYGKFRFLDLGDLSGQPLFDLVCPKNLIGPVDLYLVAHHGGPDVADPATLAAFGPRVAVMNNGTKKGGAFETYDVLHHVAGLQDVWQIHRSQAAGEKNFNDDRVANLDERSAYWIKISASEDGSFGVTNPRTGGEKLYPVR